MKTHTEIFSQKPVTEAGGNEESTNKPNFRDMIRKCRRIHDVKGCKRLLVEVL